MNLAEIFRKHGCDKADHGYAAVYEKLPEPKRLLEVGVLKGASLRAWREWWPNAKEFVGIDTFQRGEPMPIPHAVIMRMDSRDSLQTVTLRVDFDLIIDDGSHKPRDQAATFRNLWPLLAPGGHYMIEDVLPIDLYADDLPPWFADRSQDFSMAGFLELANAIAETGGKLTRHDFRAQSGLPDSVLLEIVKP